jgi:hypothetical protein
MRVEEDEQVGSSVPTVLIVPVRWFSGFWWRPSAGFAYELDGRFIEANDGPRGVRRLHVKLQDILHPGDEIRVDLGERM